MRLLGDEYIRKEFRDHRSIDNPVHIVGFLTEWQLYAQQIEGENWRGEKMDRGKIDKMSGMYERPYPPSKITRVVRMSAIWHVVRESIG